MPALLLLGLAACRAGIPAGGVESDAYQALAGRLLEGSWESREQARDALITLGGPRAVMMFSRLLGDDAGEARILAISGLSSLTEDNPKAYDLLFGLLENRSAEIRLRTLEHLAYDENPRIIPKLLERSLDPDAEVRKTALGSLQWRSVMEARPIFKAALQDPDPKVRAEAERGLSKIDWILRARDILYHPPNATPYGQGSKEEREYLKAHHAAWNFGISSLKDEEIESGKLGGVFATCCEAIVSVTEGWYSGIKDVAGFLGGVQKRMESDPSAKEKLKAYRRDVMEHPIENWYLPDR